METGLRILAAVAIAYGVIVALAYLFQRNLIYFPDRTIIAPAQTAAPGMRVVRYKAADGVKLEAWYQRASPGRPTILLFHGNAGNLAHRAAKAGVFLERGTGVLLAAYRGYAGSGGSPSEAGLLADGRAALEFLEVSGVEPGDLVLYGESLGSGVAVAMAGEFEVAALVLEAPFTSIADVAATAYAFLPVRWLLKDRFDSSARIALVRSPLLVIHGARDAVIPTALGKRLYAAANEPKELRIIAGAGHNDVFAAGGGEAALEFLEELFPEHSYQKNENSRPP